MALGWHDLALAMQPAASLLTELWLVVVTLVFELKPD
jgi:hypothetical protein